ncbi:hypothetical protein [Streptomyces iconiensis]|uniref:Uncharacterized protein n=1 Tax=Streptomyces iconiensis TaxID=1384038 RepID=A0ABT6ZYN2_9ACTN|nr:hypothetical protein [Streptomyces iconiensis]MDJ1134182.1 hypothetical protein [Streptomyces iconiensis]
MCQAVQVHEAGPARDGPVEDDIRVLARLAQRREMAVDAFDGVGEMVDTFAVGLQELRVSGR